MSTSRGTRWRICFWTHRHAMRIRLPAMLCGRDCPCLLAQVSLLRRVSPRVCSRLSMCQNSSPIPLRTIRRPPFSWLKIQRGLRSSAKKLRVTVPPPHCSMAEFLRAIWSERSSICLSDIKRPYPPNIFPFNRSAWHKTGLPSNTPDSQNCTVFPAFLHRARRSGRWPVLQPRFPPPVSVPNATALRSPNMRTSSKLPIHPSAGSCSTSTGPMRAVPADPGRAFQLG